MWAARSGGRWRWKASESQGYFQLAEHLDKISNRFQRQPFKPTPSSPRYRSLISPVAQIGETEAAFATHHGRPESLEEGQPPAQSQTAPSQCPREARPHKQAHPCPWHAWPGGWESHSTRLPLGPIRVLGGTPSHSPRTRGPLSGPSRATTTAVTSALRSVWEGAKGNLCCLLMMKHLPFPR